ncbi:hypothetical protein [Arthrobacter sp. StoSoilB13]|uniref:hypothetical protein n=1 Tax=Arthrobacter sp. StoSoilB13 TaxID=2830993 RepID=UPI0021E133D3|nr:hypothetical protein [Arthrobacter sp. StoSoilB13]
MKKCSPTIRSGWTRPSANFRHGKGRRVRQQQRISAQQGLDRREDGAFHAQLLEDRFNDHVAVPVLARVNGSTDEDAKRPRRRFVEVPAAHHFVQVCLDPGKCAIHLLLGQVRDQHRDTKLPRKDQSELAGHEPGTDNANAANGAWIRVGNARQPLLFSFQEGCAGFDDRVRVHGIFVS